MITLEQAKEIVTKKFPKAVITLGVEAEKGYSFGVNPFITNSSCYCVWKDGSGDKWVHVLEFEKELGKIIRIINE